MKTNFDSERTSNLLSLEGMLQFSVAALAQKNTFLSSSLTLFKIQPPVGFQGCAFKWQRIGIEVNSRMWSDPAPHVALTGASGFLGMPPLPPLGANSCGHQLPPSTSSLHCLAHKNGEEFVMSPLDLREINKTTENQGAATACAKPASPKSDHSHIDSSWKFQTQGVLGDASQKSWPTKTSNF